MLKNIPLVLSSRLINGGVVAYLAAGLTERYNIMPVSWMTPISQMPPLLGVSVSPACWTHHLIQESGEFCLSIPDVRHLRNVHIAGTTTGREVSKVEQLNLMIMRGQMIRAPYILDCLGHLECEVRMHYRLGDHTFFVAETVYACVEEGFFEEHWTEEAETLHYLGGDLYLCGGNILRGSL